MLPHGCRREIRNPWRCCPAASANGALWSWTSFQFRPGADMGRWLDWCFRTHIYSREDSHDWLTLEVRKHWAVQDSGATFREEAGGVLHWFRVLALSHNLYATFYNVLYIYIYFFLFIYSTIWLFISISRPWAMPLRQKRRQRNPQSTMLRLDVWFCVVFFCIFPLHNSNYST